MTCSNIFLFPAGGAGYTFDPAKTEFVGGVASLIAAVESTDIVLTPVVNAGAPVTDLYTAQTTITEAVGYTHRFAFAFDGGQWQTFDAGGWRVMGGGSADTTAWGIPTGLLTNIREWPTMTTIQMAVSITRAAGGGNGSIDSVGICWGANTIAFSDEPDGSDALIDPTVVVDGHNLTYAPDFPIAPKVIAPIYAAKFEGGYEQTVPIATTKRRVYPAAWRNRTEVEAAAIVAFLLAHQTEAFTWTPQGALAAIKCVALDPVESRSYPGAFNVQCGLVEVFP